MPQTLEVIGMGAMNLDRIYLVSHMLSDSEAMVEGFRQAPGGSAANTIYGLAKLGVATGFVSTVGEDAEGRLLVEDLHSVGVDTSHIVVKPVAATGSVLCLGDKQGRRALYVLPGANNLLSREDIDVAYLNQAQIIHFSSFTQQKQLDLQISLASEFSHSVKLSFAPGTLYCSMGLERLAPLLRRTYILFLNQDELKQLTGQSLTQGVERCLEQECQIVVVTLGKGLKRKTGMARCYIGDGSQRYWVMSGKEKVDSIADAVGAGDAFAAGFLYGFLHGKTLEDCGRLGDTMACFSLSAVGARSGLPTLPQLQRQLNQEQSSASHST